MPNHWRTFRDRRTARRAQRLLDGIVRRQNRGAGVRPPRPIRPVRQSGRRVGLLSLATPTLVACFAALALWFSPTWTQHPYPEPRIDTRTPAVAPVVDGDSLVGRASVIDGDTIEVRGVRVRLWGIDAPESKQVCRRDGKPWLCGGAAANALDYFIGGGTVRCEDKGRDRYGRTIGLCRVAGADMSAWMVDNGWALAFRRYSLDYVANEDRARAARRGIWGSDFQAPWEWRAERR